MSPVDEEQSSPPNIGEPRRRFQFDLFSLMIAVWAVAVGLSLVVRWGNNLPFLIGLGAAYGALGARALCRQWIVPGILGAVFAYWVAIGFLFLSRYLNPRPNVVYEGDWIIFVLNTVFAAVEGLAVTLILWIFIYLSKPFGGNEQK